MEFELSVAMLSASACIFVLGLVIGFMAKERLISRYYVLSVKQNNVISALIKENVELKKLLSNNKQTSEGSARTSAERYQGSDTTYGNIASYDCSASCSASDCSCDCS